MKSILNIFSISQIAFFAIVLFCLLFGYSFVNWGDYHTPFHHDADQYYFYIISLFKYHDLTFSHGTYGFWYAETPLHKLVPKTTYGMSLFYLPYYLFAELFSANNSTGYEAIYSWSIHVGCAIYSLIGLNVSRKILLNWVSEKTTSITLLIVFFGTNLFCYTLIQPELTHSVLFMLNALFIFHVIKWQQHFQKKHFFLYCFLLGLITIIRPTEIIISIFPLLIGIFSIKDLLKRLQLFLNLRIYLLIGIILFLIPIFPQLIYWKIQSGSWLFFSYGGGERFFWTDPQFINVLFSYRKGWFVYSPLMIFSVIGFLFLYKLNRKLFLATVFYFLINLYFISSWWDWTFGGSFGMRALIQTYAILTIPLAYFVQEMTQRTKNKYLKITIYASILFFCFLNIFQSNLYKHGIIHYSGMTKKVYWFTFFKKTYTKEDLDYLNTIIKQPNYELLKNGNRDE